MSEARSRLRAWPRVGLDFFEREGLLGAEAQAPRGLVDAMTELNHADIDAARTHPAIKVFFERTGDLELLIRPRWGRGFRTLARVFRWLMGAVGQLRMPLAPARILTRIAPLDGEREGRPGARACLRFYADDRTPMQVVAYAVQRRGDEALMSVVFPFPLCNLTGHLRLEEAGRDEQGRLAVRLTSERRPGRGDDSGVWLVLPWFRLRMPLGETMWLWAPSMDCAPRDLVPELWPGTTIVSRHEQRIFGVLFARHSYYFRPLGGAPR